MEPAVQYDQSVPVRGRDERRLQRGQGVLVELPVRRHHPPGPGGVTVPDDAFVVRVRCSGHVRLPGSSPVYGFAREYACSLT